MVNCGIIQAVNVKTYLSVLLDGVLQSIAEDGFEELLDVSHCQEQAEGEEDKEGDVQGDVVLIQVSIALLPAFLQCYQGA